jgi:hypothetical protein
MDIPTELAVARKLARVERLATNRAVTCETGAATRESKATLEKAA